MKFFLKSLITYFYSLGPYKSEKKGFRALAYHSITNSKPNKDMWSVDKHSFKDHLSYIQEKKITVYDIDVLKNKIPDHGMSINFDDGYRNNLEIAAPFLSEFEMPFSVFVITDNLNESKKEYLDNVLL